VGADGQSLQLVFFLFRKESDVIAGETARRSTPVVAQSTAVRRVTVATCSRSSLSVDAHGDGMRELVAHVTIDSTQYQPQDDSDADMRHQRCSTRIAEFNRLRWTSVFTARVSYSKWTND